MQPIGGSEIQTLDWENLKLRIVNSEAIKAPIEKPDLFGERDAQPLLGSQDFIIGSSGG